MKRKCGVIGMVKSILHSATVAASGAGKFKDSCGEEC